MHANWCFLEDNPRDDCHSKEEAHFFREFGQFYFEWFRKKKVYSPEAFGDAMVQTTIKHESFAITAAECSRIYYLEEQHVESEERFVELNLLPPKTIKWFELGDNPHDIWAREQNYNYAFYFTVCLSADRHMYKRSIYSSLDWLGDVGGLFDGLRGIGFLVMLVYKLILGDPLNNFLINMLFKKDKIKTP